MEELSVNRKSLDRNRLSKTDSPTVKDEVKLLCQIVLSQNILNSQAKFMSEGKSLFFRTWVGGDKDGHPHVNEKTLKDTYFEAAWARFKTDDGSDGGSYLQLN